MQGRILNHLSALRAERLPKQLRRLASANRKVISAVLVIVVVLSTGLVTVLPSVTSASETNVLGNGSFEHGFVNVPGCGVVGSAWDCFTNGGAANYGFYDDEWEPVVADGKHSQLIEINTKGIVAPDADRYAGISQTVRVQKHAKYTFSMRGMIRTTKTDSEDPWRYVVEVGWAEGPNAHWKDVRHWTDTGWYTYFPRTEPGYMSDFRTTLMPESEVITLFVRVWKKWGVPEEEIDVNVDAIALVGPSHHMKIESQQDARRMLGGAPETRANVVEPQQPSRPPMKWPEAPGGTGGACQQTDLVFNGSFEHGFNDTGYGAVGRGWGPFTNGGAANYGFYDEQWEAVISMANMSTWCTAGHDSRKPMLSGCCDDKDDKCTGHGQLIEINTKDKFPADADRYAGIYQRIGGLTPGATYTLQLRGLLRGTGDESDEYRFAAQWGINSGPDTDWRHVHHWEEMDLGPIYPRTEPGPLATYTASFKAPSSQVVLFIRAWNKWPTSGVELDFNLDDISLKGCSATSGGTGGWMGPGEPMPPGQPVPENPVGQCTYVVQSGDSLGRIAGRYGVTTAEIARVNMIDNPNIIYVGQKLTIPGCSGPSPRSGGDPQMVRPVEPVPGPRPAEERAPSVTPEERPMPNFRGVPMAPMAAGVVEPVETVANIASARTYTVRSGQSLSQIALENGINTFELAAANDISNMDIVYVGQVLRIP